MDGYEIYPKQFRKLNVSVVRNSCFVLMPFADEFDIVYGTIKDALDAEGLSCRRCDEIAGSKPIMNKILMEMLRARFVIVDLTGGNPNVFYELGITHVFKDAQNVFLIKQYEAKTPFDISHLTYTEYRLENLKLLKAQIRNFISDNSHVIDFHEALNVNGLIEYISSDMGEFVDCIQACMGCDLPIMTRVLTRESLDSTEQDAERIVLKLENLIKEQIASGSTEVLAGLLNVYNELLLSSSSYRFSDSHVKAFLHGFFLNSTASEEEYLVWQTDCAVYLAQRNRFHNIVLPWIVNYFRRSKSASIDLNRYKLEAFLMTSSSREVNEKIVNAIMDDNCYIREHFSDVVGEKRLREAVPVLLAQLQREENYYTATSMISALGKIGDAKACSSIMTWLTTHEDDIFRSKSEFVLNHARLAISKLDQYQSTSYLEEFDAKYKRKIQDKYYL